MARYYAECHYPKCRHAECPGAAEAAKVKYLTFVSQFSPRSLKKKIFSGRRRRQKRQSSDDADVAHLTPLVKTFFKGIFSRQEV